MRLFDVNFGNPSKSILTGINGSMPISVPAFDLAAVTCAPQPDSPTSEAFFAAVWGFRPRTTGLVDCLDTLGDRLMYRLAHYNKNGTQHFLVAHSVLNTTAVATVGTRQRKRIWVFFGGPLRYSRCVYLPRFESPSSGASSSLLTVKNISC